MRKKILGGLFLVSSILLGSCGEKPASTDTSSSTGGSSVSIVEKKVESIALSMDSTTLNVGDHVTLNVTISPSDAVNKDYSFTSSDTNVISISTNGEIAALKAGTSIITCELNDKSKVASLTITVIEQSPYKNLNAKQLGDYLASTPYANSEVEGDQRYGLENPGIVGVLEDTTNYYIEKADSEYVDGHVISLDAITLDEIKTYFESATEVNDTYALLTAIKKAEAITDGEDIKIKLPNRKVRIDCGLISTNKVIEISDVDNLAIVGDKTVLSVAYKDLNWKGYVTANGCDNFVMSGIEFEAEIPSTLAGTITTMDVEANTSTVKIDPEFNGLVKELLKNKRNLQEYLEFDHNTKAPLINGNFIDRGDFLGYDITGDETEGYSIVVKFKNPINRSRNNSYVALAFSEYDNSAFDVENSENVILENISVHNAPGMGLVAQKVNGFYVNRFNINIKEGSNQLMTATADGMHFVSMHGTVSVTNCIVENTHDDALNIKHGYWFKVSNPSGVDRSMDLSRITSMSEAPKVGDKIIVYNEETFAGHNPIGGSYTIEEVSDSAGGYHITVKERMSQVANWGNCRASLWNDLPSFTYKNNIVRNKRNRGVLVQVPNATVENNFFSNVGHGSIQCASAMDIYNECTVPQGVHIQNNKFVNNIFLGPEPLPGDVSVFAIANNASVAPSGTIEDIVVSNNFFNSNGNAPVCFRGVGESKIDSNFFYECCAYQVSGQQLNCLFNAYNCSSIELSNCYSEYNRDLGMCGVYLQGLSKESDITLTNNTNISFYTPDEIGPDVDLGKATSAITFDGDISEWSSIGAYSIDMLAASLATGDEIKTDAIADHFAVKAAYMTYTEDGIAMAFDVLDDLIDVKPAAAFWTGDCVEIFISTIIDMPSADMQVYKAEGGVLQMAFAPTWSASNYCTIAEARSNPSYLSKEKEISVGMKSNDNGYTVEFLLPFSIFPEFKTAIENGERICIATIVADAGRPDAGLERVQIGNVPHFVESYKTKTERMPRYLFN